MITFFRLDVFFNAAQIADGELERADRFFPLPHFYKRFPATFGSEHFFIFFRFAGKPVIDDGRPERFAVRQMRFGGETITIPVLVTVFGAILSIM